MPGPSANMPYPEDSLDGLALQPRELDMAWRRQFQGPEQPTDAANRARAATDLLTAGLGDLFLAAGDSFLYDQPLDEGFQAQQADTQTAINALAPKQRREFETLNVLSLIAPLVLGGLGFRTGRGASQRYKNALAKADKDLKGLREDSERFVTSPEALPSTTPTRNALADADDAYRRESFGSAPIGQSVLGAGVSGGMASLGGAEDEAVMLATILGGGAPMAGRALGANTGGARALRRETGQRLEETEDILGDVAGRRQRHNVRQDVAADKRSKARAKGRADRDAIERKRSELTDMISQLTKNNQVRMYHQQLAKADNPRAIKRIEAQLRNTITDERELRTSLRRARRKGEPQLPPPRKEQATSATPARDPRGQPNTEFQEAASRVRKYFAQPDADFDAVIDGIVKQGKMSRDEAARFLALLIKD